MKKIFAANWKLHKTPQETRNFLKQFLSQAGSINGRVLVFPPATSWEAAAESCKSSNQVFWGAQNVWSQSQGAFTGENSAQVLKELGGQFVLIGHSERRHVFKENPEWMADKVALAEGLGLTPVLCIGETLSQRDAGQTDSVNATQLTEALAIIKPTSPLIVAYEPVWAIGTGRVAEPQQVAEAHGFIRKFLEDRGFKNVALLYGGSVKPENSAQLLGLPNVDGFLVGGASLEVDSFLKICRSV